MPAIALPNTDSPAAASVTIGPKKSEALPAVAMTLPASLAAKRSRDILARTSPLRVSAAYGRSSVSGLPPVGPYM